MKIDIVTLCIGIILLFCGILLIRENDTTWSGTWGMLLPTVCGFVLIVYGIIGDEE